MGMQRLLITLVATQTAGAAVASTPRQVPKGADLAGVQLVVFFEPAAAGTITPRIEGSNVFTGDVDDPVPSSDDDDWITLDEGLGTGVTDDGTEVLGGTDQLLPLGQFLFIRVNYAFDAGPPLDGSTVTAYLKADYPTT